MAFHFKWQLNPLYHNSDAILSNTMRKSLILLFKLRRKSSTPTIIQHQLQRTAYSQLKCEQSTKQTLICPQTGCAQDVYDRQATNHKNCHLWWHMERKQKVNFENIGEGKVVVQTKYWGQICRFLCLQKQRLLEKLHYYSFKKIYQSFQKRGQDFGGI